MTDDPRDRPVRAVEVEPPLDPAEEAPPPPDSPDPSLAVGDLFDELQPLAQLAPESETGKSALAPNDETERSALAPNDEPRNTGPATACNTTPWAGTLRESTVRWVLTGVRTVLRAMIRGLAVLQKP